MDGDTYADGTPVPDEDDFSSDGQEDHIMSGPTFGNLPGDGTPVPAVPTDINTDVYECWVADQRESFASLRNTDEVKEWLGEWIGNLGMHERISIVRHHLSEYTS